MTLTLPLPLPARVLLLGSGELGKEVTIALQRYGCTVIACDSYGKPPRCRSRTSHASST